MFLQIWVIGWGTRTPLNFLKYFSESRTLCDPDLDFSRDRYCIEMTERVEILKSLRNGGFDLPTLHFGRLIHLDKLQK
jgi:hypothetical protein